MKFKARVDITGTDKKVKYKQGDVIKKKDAEAYLRSNPEYLEGLEFRSGKYHLPKEKPEKKKIVEEKVEEILTKQGAYMLSKAEQVALIKELGGEKIPRLEKDRVSLILKLQK